MCPASAALSTASDEQLSLQLACSHCSISKLPFRAAQSMASVLFGARWSKKRHVTASSGVLVFFLSEHSLTYWELRANVYQTSTEGPLRFRRCRCCTARRQCRRQCRRACLCACSTICDGWTGCCITRACESHERRASGSPGARLAIRWRCLLPRGHDSPAGRLEFRLRNDR